MDNLDQLKSEAIDDILAIHFSNKIPADSSQIQEVLDKYFKKVQTLKKNTNTTST